MQLFNRTPKKQYQIINGQKWEVLPAAKETKETKQSKAEAKAAAAKADKQARAIESGELVFYRDRFMSVAEVEKQPAVIAMRKVMAQADGAKKAPAAKPNLPASAQQSIVNAPKRNGVRFALDGDPSAKPVPKGILKNPIR